jgi:hypothetical protein
MIAYYCDKLCSGECCAPLRWALIAALNPPEDTATREAIWIAYGEALEVINNPTKLAELLDVALNARGVESQALTPKDGLCAVAYVASSDGEVVRYMRPIPEARGDLVAIIATPANKTSRDECERIVQGDT